MPRVPDAQGMATQRVVKGKRVIRRWVVRPARAGGGYGSGKSFARIFCARYRLFAAAGANIGRAAVFRLLRRLLFSRPLPFAGRRFRGLLFRIPVFSANGTLKSLFLAEAVPDLQRG